MSINFEVKGPLDDTAAFAETSGAWKIVQLIRGKDDLIKVIETNWYASKYCEDLAPSMATKVVERIHQLLSVDVLKWTPLHIQMVEVSVMDFEDIIDRILATNADYTFTSPAVFARDCVEPVNRMIRALKELNYEFDKNTIGILDNVYGCSKHSADAKMLEYVLDNPSTEVVNDTIVEEALEAEAFEDIHNQLENMIQLYKNNPTGFKSLMGYETRMLLDRVASFLHARGQSLAIELSVK